MKAFHKEYNPWTDAVDTYYWDDETQDMRIKTKFDCRDILESNKKLANATIDARFNKGIFHHVAEIPNIFITKILKEHNIDVMSSDKNEQLRLRKLLETPEYRFLKTTTKKLWRPKGASHGG